MKALNTFKAMCGLSAMVLLSTVFCQRPIEAQCVPPAGTYEYYFSWSPAEPKACPNAEITLSVMMNSTQPVQGVGASIAVLCPSGISVLNTIRSVSAGADIPGEWSSTSSSQCQNGCIRYVGLLAAPISQTDMVSIPSGSGKEIFRVVFVPPAVPEPSSISVRFDLSFSCGGTSYNNSIVVAGCDVTASTTPKLNATNSSIPINTCAGNFRRGDCNNNGLVAGYVGDIVYLLNLLFASGPAAACENACDANDDNSVNISDVVFLANWTFSSGSAPSSPYPSCGPDPTPGTTPLTCATTVCP
jgi:hypothetical protein